MFKKVKKGVYYSKRKFHLADNTAINFLVNACEKEGLDMGRICLHENSESKLMTMLIVLLNNYIYPPHRHSWKDESYTIISGNCLYIEYDQSGRIIDHVNMKEGDSILNCKGNFHSFKPLSPKFVFVENTIGPFTDQPLDFLKNFELI